MDASCLGAQACFLKAGPGRGWIDVILEVFRGMHEKQRHTANTDR
jgi:hypothetical protein